MKIGFLVNPVAGMGGAVALKGTDGAETLRRALALGAVPRAHLRAGAALSAALPVPDGVRFLSCGGGVGGAVLASPGIPCGGVYAPGGGAGGGAVAVPATTAARP